MTFLTLARARLAYRRIRDGEPIASGCLADDCAAPLTFQVRARGGLLRYACEAHRDHDGATVVRRIDCPRWLGVGACVCGACRC